jgi:hypothetical protein
MTDICALAMTDICALAMTDICALAMTGICCARDDGYQHARDDEGFVTASEARQSMRYGAASDIQQHTTRPEPP